MITSGSSRSAPRKAALNETRVRVHFTLRDVAAFRLEDVFDRVLERDDVLAPLEVHLLDQRGERGRFAAADRTGDKDEPILVAREQFQVLRQTEVVHRPHLRVDDAENQIEPEPLPDDTGAKTPKLRRIGKIGIAALGQKRLLPIREKTIRESCGLFRASASATSGQIGWSVPCNRQIGGAFTPR